MVRHTPLRVNFRDWWTRVGSKLVCEWGGGGLGINPILAVIMILEYRIVDRSDCVVCAGFFNSSVPLQIVSVLIASDCDTIMKTEQNNVNTAQQNASQPCQLNARNRMGSRIRRNFNRPFTLKTPGSAVNPERVHWGQTPFRVNDDPEISQLDAEWQPRAGSVWPHYLSISGSSLIRNGVWPQWTLFRVFLECCMRKALTELGRTNERVNLFRPIFSPSAQNVQYLETTCSIQSVW